MISFRNLFVISIFLVGFYSCNKNTDEKISKTTLNLNTDNNGRNDQWGFIGPGGGGAMFNPAINPSDSSHVFVSCDMTGSFVTYDGGEKWRMFNLRDMIRFYRFDKNNPDIVYAGTSKMLFKSIDKGLSWHTIYPNPKNIIAIHAQGDHASEVVVTKDSIISVVKNLAIDPDNSQKLFLLVKEKKNDSWPAPIGINFKFSMALFTSQDGGKSWEVIDRLNSEFNTIFIDPTSPKDNRTIYISSKDQLKVKKEGIWTTINMPEGAGLITQVVDGMDKKTNQHVIYASFGQSYFNKNGNKNDSRIYITKDEGQHWSRIDKPLQEFKIKEANSPEYRNIATSYANPEVLFVSFANLKTSKDTMSIGVAKTIDFGKTWKLIWNDKIEIDGKIDSGLSSLNRKRGWMDERFGPSWGENPFHMTIAENNPEICYATDFGRTIKTINGGKTWQQVYTNKIEGAGWKSRGLQVTTGYMLAFDPFDSLHVFMADTDTGLMESFDGARSWTSATHNNGVPRRWANSTYWLIFDPKVKGKVWAAMSRNHDLPRPKMWRSTDMNEYQGGILVSTNGGKIWKPTTTEIGEFAPTHIILDNKSDIKNRTLYVCAFGKGVYKSTDGGNSWQQKNKGIEGGQPAAWRMTQKKNGDIFLVVSRKSEDGSIGNDKDGALYKSTDGAETWAKMNLPEGVNGPSSIIIDPDNQNRLILAAWGRYGADKFSPNRGGGIYLSEDNGISWKAVLTKDQHIHDLTIDDRNGVFYACGFNSSAYRSENRGISWQRIKGYNFTWGKRVQPDPIDPDKVYIITFGGGVWHGPAKGDKNALEDIITPQVSYE